MALEIGSRIAHCDVTALIGEGGMGQVYQTNDLTRRRFLCGALSVFGVVAGARPLVGRSQDAGVRQEALGLLERQPAFDLHTHPGSFYRKGFDTYGGDRAVVDQFQDMVDGRLAGGFCSLVADIKILAIGPDGIRVSRAFETGEAWADYLRQATALRELVALAPARLATGPSDLPPGPGPEVAAFMAVEGGDCLEGRVSRVEELYRDGVRSVQLVHYAQNDVGDLQTADPVYDGLSPFGHQVVAEMERVGMVIDVAHASFQTVRDVAEQTNHPLVLSHSQLQIDANRHPRLITPDHASLVAGTGGRQFSPRLIAGTSPRRSCRPRLRNGPAVLVVRLG